MALKSSREGLRKELVDYLGNIIIDDNLKQNIINSIDDVFINNEELTTSVNELDEKISNESSVRELSDSNLESNKANKSDVLTLEEIQASTDLTGKIASASSLKTINTITNLRITVPEPIIKDDESIIANFKYVSSIIESYKPRTFLIRNQGEAFVIGYTYNQSELTDYACYLMFSVFNSTVYLVRCSESTWTIVRFSGV